MRVILPFVVVESDERTNQLSEGLKKLWRGGDQIHALAKTTRRANPSMSLYEALEAWVLGASNTERLGFTRGLPRRIDVHTQTIKVRFLLKAIAVALRFFCF